MSLAILRGDNVFRLFNMNIEEATPEYSRVTMPVQPEKCCNGMGLVHGGVLFSMADVAFGAAANHGEKTGTVTLSANVQFLMPGQFGPLVAEARRLRGGRHIVVYSIDIHDAQSTLLFHGTFEGFRTDFAFTESNE